MNETPYAPPRSRVADCAPSVEGIAAVAIVTFDQLRPVDRWRFFWGYLWRCVIAALLSGLGGAILGGILGAAIGGVGAALGKPQAPVLLTVRIVSAVAGGTVGFFAIWQLIRWFFRASWFGYRLRLVRDAT
jgi:hypothetical protein